MRLRNIPRANETIAASSSVIHDTQQARGRWKEIFGNSNPIHIEVGMGKGRFIIQMALQNPDINYVGIEKYASVLLRALEKKEEIPDIPNLYFLCIDARELPVVFGEKEIDKIYLNFSDPWPKERHASRRLPSREFLKRYDQILVPDGVVEFKTDNRLLFDFALEEVEPAGWKVAVCTFDLHHDEELVVGNVMTEYEEKFSGLGNPIHKMVILR